MFAIGATLTFLTVGWSGGARRAVVAVLLTSILLFLAGVAAAILTAARDTYVRNPGPRTRQ